MMPNVPMKPLDFNKRMLTEHKAQRMLAEAHGFTEIHSYSWFDDPWLEAIGYDPGPTLNLANPNAEQTGRMRTTMVPNLLAAAKFNLSHADDFRLFELGRVYIPVGKDDRDERTYLTGVSCMPSKSGDLEQHFRTIRGALEDLASMIGCGDLAFAPRNYKGSPWEKAGA